MILVILLCLLCYLFANKFIYIKLILITHEHRRIIKHCPYKTNGLHINDSDCGFKCIPSQKLEIFFKKVRKQYKVFWRLINICTNIN